jgi:Zn-dependent peptidase ImmA (M78 family)/DNA-binding XRE family transcriptional regulator
MDARHRGKKSATLGERLKTARAGTGLSTRAVAEKLRVVAPVSHATLANYERDATRPSIDVMTALAALYQRPLNWFLGDGATLSGVHYRNLKSKVGVRDKHRFEAECQRWLDAYAAIEGHVGDELKAELKFTVELDESPADAARRLRREALNLDEDDRLPSVIDLLERLGVRVMETETELAIDGLAAMMDDEYVVVLNSDVANDRARMNAAHEAGHVIRGDCAGDGEESKEQEKAAFEFASHLILTSKMLAEAFKRKSVVDLVRFKERFGISLAAMVYRAQHEHLIRESEARQLWIEFAKRGWRVQEPGRVWADRATRFEALIDSALVAGRSTLANMAEVAGVREDELRRRLALATGADNYDAEQEESPAEKHRLRIVH